MANIEKTELCSYSNEEEETKSVIETTREEITQTFEEGSALAPSFGDGRFGLVDSAVDVSSCHDKKMMDDKISPIAKQLQYLLNKADEFQAQLMWSSDCCQNDEFANIIPMFLQTCQPYFTYLESTARNSHPLRPPLSIYIRTQLLLFSQQLCSRLEQLVMMFASFSIFSVDETDPMSISHFFIGQCQIDNMKVSIFRYCYPTPFLASANTGLYKRMRWNVERETERYSGAEFYFLCCEDVLEETEDDKAENNGEKAEKESRVTRIWSLGQWIQTYPNTDDITDWVLCSVPCGQYKLLLCLGSEEPSSCTATDCLLGALLSEETDSTAVTET